MASQRTLTELEGAVLTEVACRGNDTAYKVRRALQDSPSTHWRGSAGAVSPAIRRLTAEGYLSAVPHGQRRGLRLTITDEGAGALQAWASDLDIATGLGFDPFRLRSGLWLQLPPERRRPLLAAFEEMILEQLRILESRSEDDQIDKAQTELAIGLLFSRLDWTRRMLTKARRFAR